ncbi:glycosyltransferase family 2 protein [Bradyrhizobium sp. CCBAU 11357]|uniref:glycosyltransferase family 2 protein n=1 Tax=Bradyrhizobium sp. CCBAU 11357 TaxID=1630808 RepID=UPI002304BC1A|nr:glycosyltransferase family 2 protein [Bradyrhizobium sp. CCBAU 11357]
MEGLIGKFFPGSSSLPVVAQVLGFLFKDAALDGAGASDLENVYLAHIKEIKEFSARAEAHLSQTAVLETGQQEDCLVSTIDRWDPLKLINYLTLQTVPASNKRAIVATARDEGLSILEWIAYHRVIGFDAFFIYTNDNTDGSLDLLELLARHNVLTLIKNSVAAKVSPQQKCYEHSLYFLPQLRAYNWVAYLDIDEFFRPLKRDAISLDGLFDHISSLHLERSLSSVFFNWKWFGSGLKFEMEDRFVLERFSETRADQHGKSLSRLRDIVSMRPVHYPTLLPGCVLLDSEFKAVTDIATMQPIYGMGQINHYWNKSFEEFALKKVRGLPSQGLAGKQRDFEQFFAWDARAGNASIETMPSDLLADLRREYDALLELPGIADQLDIIRRGVRSRLQELERQFDLKAVFQKTQGLFSNG